MIVYPVIFTLYVVVATTLLCLPSTQTHDQTHHRIALCVFLCLNVASISYNLVGLPDDFGIYLHFTLATILMGANFACMGQVLVALVPNKDVAQMLSGTVISVCNLLGGFFLPLPAMAAGVKWTFWINPAGYSYHVIAALLFHCDGADCPSVATVASTGVQVRTISDFMSEQLGFVYEDRWLMTLGAFAWMIGLHLIMALALRFISHLKR